MAAFYFLFWTSGFAGQWLDLPTSGPVYGAATAMTLASIVMTQIGNLFAHRTERVSILSLGRRRLLGNRLVWLGIGAELVLVVLLVYAPFANEVFGTAPFAPVYWLFLVAWVPALLVADELRKAVLRRREQSHAAPPSVGAPFIRSAGTGGGER